MAKVQLSYSKDGGHTWSNWKDREIGPVGNYNREVRFLSLGQCKSMIVKIRVSDPVKRDILGANVRIQGGQ